MSCSVSSYTPNAGVVSDFRCVSGTYWVPAGLIDVMQSRLLPSPSARLISSRHHNI